MLQLNKIPAAVCLIAMLAFRIYQYTHGQAVVVNVFLEPSVIVWSAFVLPAMLPVIAIEELVFHYAAWDYGHTWMTLFNMNVAAAIFWFFPVNRIRRWFGTFNPVSDGKRRFPSLTRGAAHVLDAVNKRLFGRQKTGGWA